MKLALDRNKLRWEYLTRKSGAYCLQVIEGLLMIAAISISLMAMTGNGI